MQPETCLMLIEVKRIHLHTSRVCPPAMPPYSSGSIAVFV